jgi:hypothetical protein
MYGRPADSAYRARRSVVSIWTCPSEGRSSTLLFDLAGFPRWVSMGQRFLSYKGILQCYAPLVRLRHEDTTQDCWGRAGLDETGGQEETAVCLS